MWQLFENGKFEGFYILLAAPCVRHVNVGAQRHLVLLQDESAIEGSCAQCSTVVLSE